MSTAKVLMAVPWVMTVCRSSGFSLSCDLKPTRCNYCFIWTEATCVILLCVCVCVCTKNEPRWRQSVGRYWRLFLVSIKRWCSWLVGCNQLVKLDDLDVTHYIIGHENKTQLTWKNSIFISPVFSLDWLAILIVEKVGYSSFKRTPIKVLLTQLRC